MTTTPPTSKNPTHSPSRPVTEPLNALQTVFPDGEAVLTKAKPETKAGDGEGWNDRENRLTSDEGKARVRRGDNVGVALGHETSGGPVPVVVDGEDPDAIPDAVVAWCNNRARFSWWSPHGGQNWLLLVTPEAYERLKPFHQTKLDFGGDGDHELELLTKGHALIPPSTIEHRYCKESKDCDGTGTGSYHLLDVNPPAPEVDVDAVEDLLGILDLDPAEGSAGSTASYDPENFPEPTEADVEAGKAALEEFYQSTGKKPSDDLHAVLNGKSGSLDLPRHDDGTIDRDRADSEAICLLLCAMEDDEKDIDRAEELAAAVYSHFCEETPVMKDGSGRPRKWNRDDGYRANRLDAARTFYENHRERFTKWKRRTYSTTEGSDGPRATHGNYSATTIDAVEGALHALADAETKDEVKTNVRAFALERDFAVPDSVSYPPPPSHKVPTPPEPDATGGWGRRLGTPVSDK